MVNTATRDDEKLPEVSIGVRLPPPLLDQVDAHREYLARRTPGVAFSRSDAIKALLTAGLSATEPST